ncbi:hypothetical protein DFJ73DRAFT_828210 [Zopfochytrium polystomum]|nr:hypothetical protein DFJ73DRAFT_828210 [Zopfochytrium polystomum]
MLDDRTRLKLDAIQMRIDNELYLRRHPEIKDIMGYLTSQVLVSRPDNIQDYLMDLMADPDLPAKVAKHRAETPAVAGEQQQQRHRVAAAPAAPAATVSEQ